MTTIIVTHEDNEVEKFEFETEQRTIFLGRRTTNDVCIPDLSVSGNHAKITLRDKQAILEDLNSTNGTYVNGQVIQRTAIHAGDEIILGKILLGIVPAESAEELLTPVSTEKPELDSAGNSSATETDSPEDFKISAGNKSSISDEPLQIKDLEASAAAPADSLSGSASEDVHSADESEQAHPLEGIEHLIVPSAKPAATPMHELDSPSTASKGAVIEIKNGAKSGQILPIDKPVTTLGRPGIQIAAIMRKPDGYFLMHIESDDSVDRPTLNRDSIGDEPVLLHSGDELTVAGIDVEFMLS